MPLSDAEIIARLIAERKNIALSVQMGMRTKWEAKQAFAVITLQLLQGRK